MNNRKVLIVEDNRELSALAAEYLLLAGFAVTEAANSSEALLHLGSAEQFDALLVDVRMPGELDGISLAQRFRQAYPEIPILVCSGYGAHLDTLIATLGPPSSFLAKPYVLADMGKILAGMVGLVE